MRWPTSCWPRSKSCTRGRDERRRRDRDTEAPSPTTRSSGTVAVVGFPNAGKSTLINRLTGTRRAVVDETPGVTRDRNEVVCEWGRDAFLLVDTGGVDVGDDTPMQAAVAEQARQAVAEADLVLLVIDAQAGLAAGDEEIASILRRSGTPVIVVANKLDDADHEQRALELHSLGLGDPVPLSALHGRGSGDLLDLVVAQLREHGDERRLEESDDIRVAILGRPNVGKSSLMNAILGRPRVIVVRHPGHHARSDRYELLSQRRELPACRYRRPAPQAPPPPGDRVLQRAAHPPGRRSRRHGACPDRRERRRDRGRSVSGRRRPQVELRDAGRAVEVGYLDDHHRRRGRPAQRQAAPAARDRHDVVGDRPQHRQAARRDRPSCSSPTARASARGSSTA